MGDWYMNIHVGRYNANSGLFCGYFAVEHTIHYRVVPFLMGDISAINKTAEPLGYYTWAKPPSFGYAVTKEVDGFNAEGHVENLLQTVTIIPCASVIGAHTIRFGICLVLIQVYRHIANILKNLHFQVFTW